MTAIPAITDEECESIRDMGVTEFNVPGALGFVRERAYHRKQ